MAGGGDILGSGTTGTDTGLGGKLGGVGAGDPSSFLSAGGGFGFDPTTMGDIMGDPTGSVGAAQNLDAGASSPTDPGGGIGGAQSGTPTVGQGVQGAPQPAPQPQQASPDASPAMASAQQFMKPTSFQLGAPQSVAGPTGLESQQPASFNDRFNAAPLSGAVQQTSPSQLADFWNNLDASGAPGTQAAPNAVSVGLSNSAGTATPYAQQSEAGQLPGTAGDLPDQAATDSGTPAALAAQAQPDVAPTPAAARTSGTQAAPGGQAQQNEPQTTGQGRGAQQGGQQGGIPQQAQINPQRIIQALMQGGPMGALEELAREAMGGGTQQGPGQYAPSQYADQVPRGYTRQNEPPWAPGYGPSTGIYTTAQRGTQSGAPQGGQGSQPSAAQGAEGVQGLPGSPSGPAPQRGGAPESTLAPIRRFEGFDSRAKWDYHQNTNGYGTRARYPGEVISRDEAERRLQSEAGRFHDMISQRFPTVPQNVKNALTSFTFNVGEGWMSRNRALAAAIDGGNYSRAGILMQQYNRAGGRVIPGLVQRRRAEAQMMMAQPSYAQAYTQ